jgi:hypothetical protein
MNSNDYDQKLFILAGQAMQALIEAKITYVSAHGNTLTLSSDDIASMAVKHAKSLLRELDKEAP